MNEKDTAIIDLLKRNDPRIRLSTGDRWMVWNPFYERWEVLSRSKEGYPKRILLTIDLQEALLTLVQE